MNKQRIQARATCHLAVMRRRISIFIYRRSNKYHSRNECYSKYLWSFTVFATVSSQMVALGLVQSSASIVVIMFTTFIINLRHMLYSASMSEHMKEYPLHMY